MGITHGDTNGIGYEVILKMLEDSRMADIADIIVYGSAKAASFYRKAMEMHPVQLQKIEHPEQAKEGTYSIINVIGEDLKIEPGVPSPAAGQAALAALEAATAHLREGAIDVLVTAPIDKHSIQSPGFAFPGHTEYLQAVLTDEDHPGKSLMILCNEDMRIALATAHLPLAKVPETLSKELILEKIEALDHSLRHDFGCLNPRIAVLALNPHAGEQGLLGSEEKEIISPAISEAQDKKILAFGPYAADGFFGSGNYKSFDGILAMYHDQGLAPFKALAMDSGVNFTAGLPYVRTSPDHGTGYDIAGQGKASPDSLRAAVYAAVDIFRNRMAHNEAYSRSLRKS